MVRNFGSHSSDFGNSWVVILAGGEGQRLRSLSAGPDGQNVPKQYCTFQGGRSLLGDTLARARGLVPNERIVVVVADQHRTWWSEELTDLPAENIVDQPLNRGTAVGLLLACVRLLGRDPEAVVTVLPADHHIEDEQTLRAACERAARYARRRPESVVLLGITPDRPDGELGWIVPTGVSDGQTSGVRTFVEKPAEALAVQLMEQGALWSSFMFTARLGALVRLCERTLPEIVAAFLAWDSRDASREPRRAGWIEELYSLLPTRDFSRDVLVPCVDALRVLAVPTVGWTDLGTPDRVRRCVDAARTGAAAMAGPGRATVPARVPTSSLRPELARAFRR